MGCITWIGRYVRPGELPERYKETLSILSEYEVFLSEQTSLLFVDFITKRCKVLSFE